MQVHDNIQIPQIIDPYVCGYCSICFSSRNKLFNHLEMMGIDTLSPYKYVPRKFHRKRIHQDNIEQQLKRLRIK